MIDKALESVTKADIDDLIATQRVEDRQIEYKRALPGNTDEEKKSS